MALRTKEIWTSGLDEAINFPYERYIRNGETFLKQWAEFFGEDYEAERQARQNRVVDEMALGIIDKVYPMSYLDNFEFIEALKRLAQSGRITRKKNGWKLRRQT